MCRKIMEEKTYKQYSTNEAGFLARLSKADGTVDCNSCNWKKKSEDKGIADKYLKIVPICWVKISTTLLGRESFVIGLLYLLFIIG